MLIKQQCLKNCGKFKRSDTVFKYFIGYKDDSIVRNLCIFLPQMSGFMKYFDNGGKNMSFMIEDYSALSKYIETWNNIKETKGIQFLSNPVFDEKYIKAKVKEFNDVVNTNFLGNDIPKEGVHHTCIACRSIDSVIKMDKNNYPQVYLEECKFKIKKKKMLEFINVKLELDSSSDYQQFTKILQ